MHLDNTYGRVPDALEVILEPDNVNQLDGTTIGKAISVTMNRLSANGYNPDIIAPSNTNMKKSINYFDDMMRVPGVSSYITEFSYHRYRESSDTNLQSIAARAKNSNIKTSMLEWWAGTNNYKVLHKDLTMGHNSAWQNDVYRSIFNIDSSNPTNPVISINTKNRFYRQYFKHVRIGAQRIEATSNNANFEPLAFINPDGKYTVVVKSTVAGSFNIEGLPAGTYGIFHTLEQHSDPTTYEADVSINAAEMISAYIPATGVITIYNK